MGGAVIEVGVKANLGGVTFPQEILPVRVCNQHELVARIELIQPGIAVLLAHIEHGQVVLPAVIRVVAKNARSQVDVVEEESAKIAAEGLVAKSACNEIVVVRQVAQMEFQKRLL